MNELQMQDSTTFSLTPRNLSEAMEFAKIIASSDMVPKDYINKPGNVLVAVQTGAELGLKPMQSLQGISVINGRPGVWGDAMWALILSHPEYEDSTEEKSDTKCTVTLKRRNKSAVIVTFSMEDAKKAGLAGKQGPWQTAPKRMLQMRARAFACRDLFADALKGIKSVEELRDYPPEPREVDITPAAAPEPVAPAVPDELIESAKKAASGGVSDYSKFWTSTGKENRHLLASMHDQFKADAAAADANRTIEQSSAPDSDFVAEMDAAATPA